MENKTTDLSARLLATENLSVVRASVRTAGFDIKSRVLTLPLWKDMTPEIEDMLVGHEVGHALYTGDDYLKPIQDNPKIMSYLNVLEDVRIEKMMKRKYPGLRKRMNEGYKQLNDRDFFGVKQVQNLDDLLLIDKINLYFKAGFSCGVKFTPEEKAFVNRAEHTETIEEIIDLANDIYAFSKQQVEDKKKQQANTSSAEDEQEEDPVDEFDDFEDQEFDDFEEMENPDAKPTQTTTQPKQDPTEATPEELESKTERNFAKQLEDLADETTQYIYHEFDTDYFQSPIVSYKTVLSETKPYWYADDSSDDEKARIIKSYNSEYESFKNETMRAVNYLVKEFEMRKSAQLYKRAQISKVGSLDMKRIWSYKLQDDLFKRVTTLPQGKNHGMVMLLDWSGSMDGVIEDTLKQVINLAMFCQRIQIPFRVLAFTSQYLDRRHNSNNAGFDYDKYRAWSQNKYERNVGKNILSNTNSFHLLELFSSKMTNTEFHSMARRIIHRRFQWNDGYGMGGTPLNEALAWVYLNLGDYIKANSIEKTTLITLTDGEGGNLSSSGDLSEQTYTYDAQGKYKRIKQKHFIRDEYTQKTYELSRYSGIQTNTILSMIKDRYDISVVGFYICRNHRRDLESAINANLPKYSGDTTSQIDAWRKEFRDNGFASVKNTGRDELFLIPQESTKIKEGELSVNADANSKVIAKNFGKFLNTKKTSRVLLNRFVGYVA